MTRKVSAQRRNRCKSSGSSSRCGSRAAWEREQKRTRAAHFSPRKRRRWAPFSNSRGHNDVRRVTSPWRTPVSSAAPKNNPAGPCGSSLQHKNNPPLWSRGAENHSHHPAAVNLRGRTRALVGLKAGGGSGRTAAACGEAARAPLYCAADAQRLSPPLRAAHSCVGSALAPTIPKQPTTRSQPEQGGQSRAQPSFSGSSFASISLVFQPDAVLFSGGAVLRFFCTLRLHLLTAFVIICQRIFPPT